MQESKESETALDFREKAAEFARHWKEVNMMTLEELTNEELLEIFEEAARGLKQSNSYEQRFLEFLEIRQEIIDRLS